MLLDIKWPIANQAVLLTNYCKIKDKFSETVHLMLNDPSMGLYRIQEHVKRSVPELVERKVSVLSKVMEESARL